ncbi:MAG TPA: hypothetical protein VK187_08930 [Geobacteraceae bacterium]|nr:hypothetical protein [Geobacteraceae bacterium]
MKLFRLLICFTMICTIQFSSVAYAEFYTPEFAQGLPYSKFSKYVSDKTLNKYFILWKKIFQSVNNVGDDEFEKRIKFFRIFNKEFQENDDYLTVEHFVTIGWFTSRLRDCGLPLMLASSREEYRFVNLRRDAYLSEEEIRRYLAIGDYKCFAINLKEPLIFSNKEQALAKLREMLEVDHIPEDKIIYDIIDGEPVMSVTVAIDSKANYCRRGTINLIAGTNEVDRTVCFVIH